MNTADLIIIGAGPGGYETAIEAARLGLRTVLIEERQAGGTCLNEGCIPTKCLCRTAELMADMAEAPSHGIDVGPATFDLSRAMARKNVVVSQLRDGIAFLLKNAGVIYVSGRARFVDSHTVAVDSSAETTCYTAPHLIIATGSTAKRLPIEGVRLPGVLTSKELLNIDHVPGRLCVIGGGVIGLEFASIFQALDSRVTVLEYCKEILPNFDTDIAKRLKAALKQHGIAVQNQAAVSAIRQQADGSLLVEYDCRNKAEQVPADTVLMAVGRAANVGSLNLSDVGISFSPRGIEVDDNMLTNVPHIYAIGDVNGRCQLAHAATFQGKRALHHLLDRPDGLRLDIMPAAVFTRPEAATVGLTEEACKQAGLDYKTGKAMMRSNGKALAMGQPEGMVKLIWNAADGRLLGGHLFGAHAADLVQEVASLMQRDATVADLRHTIHAHPTLGEVVMAAAQ